MKKISHILLSSYLGASFVFNAFGWGQKGHDTVAAIAENHFTASTAAAIDSLLDGRSVVYWANWLDNASHTPEYAYSKTWHYKNIDAGKSYEKASKLKEGDIVTALYDQIAILQDSISSKDEKALALKMTVHLLGDIHQPMHMGHASDRGGNKWYIKYFRSANNLHSVWDSNIVEAAHKWSYSEWRDQIDRATPEQQMEIIAGGTPDTWGKQTYEICTKIYDETPVDYNISYDYIADWTPVIEQQFLRGGLRLADLLNSIFDKEYTIANGVVKR